MWENLQPEGGNGDRVAVAGEDFLIVDVVDCNLVSMGGGLGIRKLTITGTAGPESLLVTKGKVTVITNAPSGSIDAPDCGGPSNWN